MLTSFRWCADSCCCAVDDAAAAAAVVTVVVIVVVAQTLRSLGRHLFPSLPLFSPLFRFPKLGSHPRTILPLRFFPLHFAARHSTPEPTTHVSRSKVCLFSVSLQAHQLLFALIVGTNPFAVAIEMNPASRPSDQILSALTQPKPALVLAAA